MEKLFPGELIAFRITTTIIAFCAIFLAYLVGYLSWGWSCGTLMAIFLATYPLIHWQARSEHVVILSPLLIMPAFFWFLSYRSKRSLSEWFGIGYIAGFSLHFHWAVGMAWPMILVVLEMVQLIFLKHHFFSVSRVRSYLVLAFGYALALAPRAQYLSEFIKGGLLKTTYDPHGIYPMLSRWMSAYHSTLVGFIRPIPFAFHGPQVYMPICFWPTLLFLGASLFSLLFRTRRARFAPLIAAVICLLLFPFSHSAITDAPLAPHRFIVLYPFLAYLSASGWHFLQTSMRMLRQKLRCGSHPMMRFFGSGMWLTVALILIAWPLPSYVTDVLAIQREKDRRDYGALTFHFAKMLRELHFNTNTQLCLITNNAALAQHLSYVHVHEQIEYFGRVRFDYRIITSDRYPDIRFVAVSVCDSDDKRMGNFKLNYREFWNDWVFATADPIPESLEPLPHPDESVVKAPAK